LRRTWEQAVARKHAFDIAREDPPFGATSEAAAIETVEVLKWIGDTCPECAAADEGEAIAATSAAGLV
jgi:hypothetical protein